MELYPSNPSNPSNPFNHSNRFNLSNKEKERLIFRTRHSHLITCYDECIVACAKGDIESVKKYISKGMRDFQRMMETTCKYGHVELFVFLQSYIDNHNRKPRLHNLKKINIYWQTCLKRVAESGNTSIIKLIFQHSSPTGKSLNCIAMHCIQNNRLDAFKLFLEKGADNFLKFLKCACYSKYDDLFDLIFKKYVTTCVIKDAHLEKLVCDTIHSKNLHAFKSVLKFVQPIKPKQLYSEAIRIITNKLQVEPREPRRDRWFNVEQIFTSSAHINIMTKFLCSLFLRWNCPLSTKLSWLSSTQIRFLVNRRLVPLNTYLGAKQRHYKLQRKMNLIQFFTCNDVSNFTVRFIEV